MNYTKNDRLQYDFDGDWKAEERINMVYWNTKERSFYYTEGKVQTINYNSIYISSIALFLATCFGRSEKPVSGN